MLLKNYDSPSEEELEAAFRTIYHFIQGFTLPQKILVWLICRLMGDRLYVRVAQAMHGATMRTLHDASFGMHADFFKRKRAERREIRELSRDWVPAEEVDLPR